MYKYLILCFAILASIHCLPAFVSEYTFMSGMKNYSAISGGTVLGTSANDENSFQAIPIGFDFIFDSHLYSQISVNTNGFIVMGATAQNSNWAISNANENASNHVIAALNRDLKSKTTGSLMYRLKGTAPFRVLIIQWADYQRYSSSNAGDTLNFQIQLHETSNIVEIQYGHIMFGNSNLATNRFQIGLRGDSSTDFMNRKVINGINTWSTSFAGTVNSDVCEMSPSLKPSSGLTYLFFPAYISLPSPANAVTPLINAENVPSGTSLTWASGNGISPSGYRIYLGTDNPPTNLVNGIDVGLLTHYSPTSALSYSTTYYWQIVPYNQFGNAVFCPVWSFSTSENHIAIDITLNMINLSWSVIPNTTGYIVQGSNQVDSGFADISGSGIFTTTGATVSWKSSQVLPYRFYRMKSVSN